MMWGRRGWGEGGERWSGVVVGNIIWLSGEWEEGGTLVGRRTGGG